MIKGYVNKWHKMHVNKFREISKKAKKEHEPDYRPAIHIRRSSTRTTAIHGRANPPEASKSVKYKDTCANSGPELLQSNVTMRPKSTGLDGRQATDMFADAHQKTKVAESRSLWEVLNRVRKK